MKKVIFLFIIMISWIFNKNVLAMEKDKVKVYVFVTSEGCTYSKEQIAYLENLASYNQKFEIVQKELFVDTTNWEKGEDYDTAKVLIKEFKNAGFDLSEYMATPFIVISDLYAAMTDARDLEGIIDKAYELGDKDIVGCIESSKKNCLNVEKKVHKISITQIIIFSIIGLFLVIVFLVIVMFKKDK